MFSSYSHLETNSVLWTQGLKTGGYKGWHGGRNLYSSDQGPGGLTGPHPSAVRRGTAVVRTTSCASLFPAHKCGPIMCESRSWNSGSTNDVVSQLSRARGWVFSMSSWVRVFQSYHREPKCRQTASVTRDITETGPCPTVSVQSMTLCGPDQGRSEAIL